MNFLRRFLRPPNALLLCFDHLEQEDAERLEEQIKEVRQYYQFVKLSQIVEALQKRQALGMAAIVFKQARKSLMVRGLSRTRDEEIPITLMLDAERVGTNRLPLDEELRVWEKHYPGKIPADELARRLEQCWTHPAEVEAFLIRCRSAIGPLPLNQMNPTQYLLTWGNLREIPPHLLECGAAITARPEAGDLSAQLAFIRQQTRQPVNLAYSPRPVSESALAPLGLQALVGNKLGIIEKGTSVWDLPQYEMGK